VAQTGRQRTLVTLLSVSTSAALFVTEIARAQAAHPAPTTAPVAEVPALPPIDVGAWLRVGARVQGTDPHKLDDQSIDTIYAQLHAAGKVHKNVSLALGLNANGLAKSVAVMDAIIGFDFADPIHLWLGQLLVPVDRSNAAGPFFMIPWNYPGFLSVGAARVVLAPKTGPSGRNAGAVAWGDFAGGAVKYFAGVFDSGDVTQSPLYSGRLSVAFVGTEPGFWGNSSYFGKKDVLALGVAGQFQRRGSTAAAVPTVTTPLPDDYGEVNADGLAELLIGSGAWVTGEGAYYHFSGANNPVKDAFFVLGAIASPKVGWGNIQPAIRFQMGTGHELTVWSLDMFVSYLIKGPVLRATIGFQHVHLDNDMIGNAIQLGAQAIIF
jgi:hypothetical protein